VSDRVMVFIDGSNFYHHLKSSFGRTDLDYYCLSQKLAGSRTLVRTYYYNCPIVRTVATEELCKRQQKFFDRLHNTPYLELVLGRLQKKSNGTYQEKGVDVKLALHMLHKAYRNQYDVAILSSGDADLVEVVQAVKDTGKHVELAYFPNQKCYHLKNAADRLILLTPDFIKDCWAT